MDGHTKCWPCRQQEHKEEKPIDAPTSPSPPPLSLFGRPAGCIDQLSETERAAIVTLHKVGWCQESKRKPMHADTCTRTNAWSVTADHARLAQSFHQTLLPI